MAERGFVLGKTHGKGQLIAVGIGAAHGRVNQGHRPYGRLAHIQMREPAVIGLRRRLGRAAAMVAGPGNGRRLEKTYGNVDLPFPAIPTRMRGRPSDQLPETSTLIF